LDNVPTGNGNEAKRDFGTQDWLSSSTPKRGGGGGGVGGVKAKVSL